MKLMKKQCRYIICRGRYEEVITFLRHPWKVITFCVNTPRNWLLSEGVYMESTVITFHVHTQYVILAWKSWFFKFLTAYKTRKKWFHTKKISLWVISNNLGLQENLVKTWGHQRIIFLLSADTPMESKTIITNISAKSRPNSEKLYGLGWI